MTVATTTTLPAGTRQPRQISLSPSRALAFPLVLTAMLAGIAVLPAARSNITLFWSIVGTAISLAIGLVALGIRKKNHSLTFEIAVRPQHYLQACAQGSVLLYWGWYWRPVYDMAPLIGAQLLFAYVFDMLLAWSRRSTYTLGFAPFPVIFSTNLFLWFKPDWFYLQFMMIALGFAAKELIRWQKDGRRTHIFNPSSFPLAVFSIGLILTGTTSWTYGPEIARTQFNPPNIYLFLFLIGLPGQFLFGVTTMTMSAVVTTYLFGVIYYAVTGAYFFIDSYIPIAVFLGMHLLFTDPSTAPKTELGRILFGVLYGLGNLVLYELLGHFGVPQFYDKLLPVPLMNLSIRFIDRIVRSSSLARFDPAQIGRGLTPRLRNLAYIGVWVLIFGAMSRVDAVGDNHPGHQVPFWQQACLSDARNGCENLALILDTYCDDGSGWACNEVAVLRWHGRSQGAERVETNLSRGCQSGYPVSCQNLVVMPAGAPPRQAPPRLTDYPIILRTGKGALPDQTPIGLLTRACDQKWPTGCEDLGAIFLKGNGAPRDSRRAADAFDKACELGLATACSNFGLMYYTGDGVERDREKGLAYLNRACERGLPNACRWLKEYQ